MRRRCIRSTQPIALLEDHDKRAVSHASEPGRFLFEPCHEHVHHRKGGSLYSVPVFGSACLRCISAVTDAGATLLISPSSLVLKEAAKIWSSPFINALKPCSATSRGSLVYFPSWPSLV